MNVAWKILAVLVAAMPLACHATDPRAITEIQRRFSQWQPIIKKEFGTATTAYRYASGENFQNIEWLTKKVDVDEKRLVEKISLIRKGIGAWIYKEEFSFSGDWFITSEHYYDESGKLYFVVWKMNTFQAEKPATVEKRLYFDGEGKLVRNLVDTYEMNTQKKIRVSFMDRPVSYEHVFNELEFLKYIKK